MSDLTKFRDHCRTMAARDHKPECPSLPKNRPHWSAWSPEFGDDGITALRWNGPPPTAPTCDGCLTDADRALFSSMAGEIEDYLAPQPDLFGETTAEPMREPAMGESEVGA